MWSAARANAWSATQPWRAGANYLPSNVASPLELFMQNDTWDEKLIDRELGWAASANYTAVRFFLHNLPWATDKSRFFERVDSFLRIADAHGIGTMLVLFDGCWDPVPTLGPYSKPRPRVHNSRWHQAPGKEILASEHRQLEMVGYVTETISRYGKDPRVLVWDLFNELDNSNANSYGHLYGRVPAAEDAKGTELAPLIKAQTSRSLLNKTFSWARAIGPTQPLTSCTYDAPSGDPEADDYSRATAEWILDTVDVISFHHYGRWDEVEGYITELEERGRPIICTEFMARSAGSTFDPVLGLFRQRHVWGFNWGLVDGKSQTKYPWETWQVEYTAEPNPWHHDVFFSDGTPYSPSEVEYLRDPIYGPRWVDSARFRRVYAPFVIGLLLFLLFVLFCGSRLAVCWRKHVSPTAASTTEVGSDAERQHLVKKK